MRIILKIMLSGTSKSDSGIKIYPTFIKNQIKYGYQDAKIQLLSLLASIKSSSCKLELINLGRHLNVKWAMHFKQCNQLSVGRVQNGNDIIDSQHHTNHYTTTPYRKRLSAECIESRTLPTAMSKIHQELQSRRVSLEHNEACQKE